VKATRGQFKLVIRLGNEAMLTADDVARALRGVAEKLENGRAGGHVVDLNGNVVGDFELGTMPG
jgi:hypothetical protein